MSAASVVLEAVREAVPGILDGREDDDDDESRRADDYHQKVDAEDELPQARVLWNIQCGYSSDI